MPQAIRQRQGRTLHCIPSVRSGRSSEELELSKKQRVGFLAAISRVDLMGSKLENGHICSRHFISGKTAELVNNLSPVWLLRLNLGHSKVKRSSTSEDRYERKRSRVARVSEGVHSTAEAPMPDPDRQIAFDGCDAAAQMEIEDTTSHSPPFTESYMEKAGDTFMQHYTGLPSFRMLKGAYCDP